MNQIIQHPLQGEIILPGEVVRVTVRPSPFHSKWIECSAPVGATLQDTIAVHCKDALKGRKHGYLRVFVNGTAFPQEWWPRVRLKSGAEVNIVAVPSGDVVKTVVSIVAAVVVAVATFFLAPIVLGALGLAAGTAAASIVTAGIGIALSVGASLAINALFPKQATPQAVLSGNVDAASSIGSETTSPTYSIGGGQNKVQQFGTIPQILGIHRVSPPYAAQPYTEVVGNEQYLRMLFCVGYGPLQISDMRIGETPITQFEGISYQVVENHLTESQSIYSQVVFEEQLSILLESSTASVRTTADNVSTISGDFYYPSGVYRYQRSDGTKQAYGFNVYVQYRATGTTGAWISAATINATGSNEQPLRRSFSFAVASGQYDVRITRDAEYSGGDTVADQVNWVSLRGLRPVTPVKFPKPLTLVALRLKASAELNGVVNTFNCIATPLIKSWNGTAWVAERVSQNPADIFRHILQGDANSTALSASQIDLETLQDWSDYCRSQGFKFNHVRDFRSGVRTTLQDVAAAGRAAVIHRDGKWSVVWDDPAAPIVQHITTRNSSAFESSRSYKKLPHAFRVSFINEDRDYLNDERIVYDDGYTEANATVFEGIDFTGITDPDLIWRHARYYIATNRLRREAYKLDVDFEHLMLTRGDRVAVNYDVVNWGNGAARVKSVVGSVVTLDDTLTMEAGKAYNIRVRLSDGSSLVRTVATVAGETKQLTLTGSGDVPSVGDLVQFGEVGFESVILRVQQINPKADYSAQLILVDDAPAIAQADQGTIPEFFTGIAPSVDLRALRVRSLAAQETLQGYGSPPRSTIAVSWLAPSAGTAVNYIVQKQLNGGDWSSEQFSTLNTSYANQDPGNYNIRVRAVFDDGQLSAWSTIPLVVDQIAQTPPDVTNFAAAAIGDQITLSWAAVPNIRHYEVRYTPEIIGAVWASASVLQTNITTTSIQVPAMAGVYFIKAVSWQNKVSINAASINSSVGPISALNVVDTITESPGFVGSKTDTVLSSLGLMLASQVDVYGITDKYAMTDAYIENVGYVSEGYYYFNAPFDLSQVYTSRVTASVLVYGYIGNLDVYGLPDAYDVSDKYGVASESLWDVTLEKATTNDDPATTPTWSGWSEFVVGDVSARAFKFRLRLNSNQWNVSPVVTTLSVSIDMPDRVIAGNGIAVGSGGATITFSPAFKELQGVGVSTSGMLASDGYVLSGETETGFSILLKNAAGTNIAGTINYVAKGYGAISA